MGGVVFSIRDWSNEVSSTSIRWTDLNAGNIAAELANIAALMTAVEGVTLADIFKETIKAEENLFTPPAPPNTAQREVKWLVRGTDTVLNVPVNIEIPTADFSLLAPGSDLIDVTSAAWTALKAALDAGWLSRAGNLVVANDAVLVGRRG